MDVKVAYIPVLLVLKVIFLEPCVFVLLDEADSRHLSKEGEDGVDYVLTEVVHQLKVCVKLRLGKRLRLYLLENLILV